MKNLKLGAKIFWSFILITVIASVSGVMSIFMINRISSQAGFALEKYGFATGEIGQAIIMLTDSRRLCRDVVNFNEQKDSQNAATALESTVKLYHQYVDNVKTSIVDEEGIQMIKSIEKKGDYYLSILDTIISQASTGTQLQRHALQNRMKNELDPAYNDLYKQFSDLFYAKQSAGYALTRDFVKLSNVSLYGTIVLIAGSMLFSLLLSLKLSRGVSKPIQQAVDAAKNLEQGNLDIDLAIKSNDEIGTLSKTFMEMAFGLKTIIADINLLLGEMAQGNFQITSSCPEVYAGEYKKVYDAIKGIRLTLSDTLNNINIASEQVATGSNQVATGSQALSQGATEQAASIEQLTHTVEEISMQIGENSENCQQASVITNKATSTLGEGAQQMQSMINAMEEISATSGEIGKIIKTIDDIAFQTNILALNAAVEAARAGAAGKGFAVVADEVRNLASKCAEAAKNTTDLIGRSIMSVDNGNKIALNTANTINTVVANAYEVTRVVEKIANASERQALSVMQVTEGMEQIAVVVQTNSATAEESAAASEELSAQAKMLKDLVSTFVLAEEETTTCSTESVQENSMQFLDEQAEKYC